MSELGKKGAKARLENYRDMTPEQRAAVAEKARKTRRETISRRAQASKPHTNKRAERFGRPKRNAARRAKKIGDCSSPQARLSRALGCTRHQPHAALWTASAVRPNRIERSWSPTFSSNPRSSSRTSRPRRRRSRWPAAFTASLSPPTATFGGRNAAAPFGTRHDLHSRAHRIDRCRLHHRPPSPPPL